MRHSTSAWTSVYTGEFEDEKKDNTTQHNASKERTDGEQCKKKPMLSERLTSHPFDLLPYKQQCTKDRHAVRIVSAWKIYREHSHLSNGFRWLICCSSLRICLEVEIRWRGEDRWIFKIKLRNFLRITFIPRSRWWMNSRSSSTRNKMMILLSRRTRFIIIVSVSVSLSIVKKINSKSNEQKQWSLAAISSITSTNRILSIHVRCIHLSSLNTDSWASNGVHTDVRVSHPAIDKIIFVIRLSRRIEAIDNTRIALGFSLSLSFFSHA